MIRVAIGVACKLSTLGTTPLGTLGTVRTEGTLV